MRAANYRVYKNGKCVALGGYAACRLVFRQECRAADPFNDVVLFVDHFMKPLDSY